MRAGGGLRLTPGASARGGGREGEDGEEQAGPSRYLSLENGDGGGGGREDAVGAAVDGVIEDAELARLLPTLTRPNYYTEPPLQQVRVQVAWLL